MINLQFYNIDYYALKNNGLQVVLYILTTFGNTKTLLLEYKDISRDREALDYIQPVPTSLINKVVKSCCLFKSSENLVYTSDL